MTDKGFDIPENSPLGNPDNGPGGLDNSGILGRGREGSWPGKGGNDWTNMGLTNSPNAGAGTGTGGRRGGLNALGVEYKSHAVGDGGVGGPKDETESRRLDDASEKGKVKRKELAKIADRQQGVSIEELSMILRYLPKEFLNGYMSLIDAGVGERNLGSGGGAGNSNVVFGSGKKKSVLGSPVSEVVGTISSAVKEKGQGNRKVPIKSEAAVAFRGTINRKLRGMLRDIQTFLDANDRQGKSKGAVTRRCGGKCKRYGDPDFLYCPNCGAPMIDIDQPRKS